MPSSQHLIPIIQRENNEQWVDARFLHQFLKSKQEFANWIKSRIEDYGFVEGRDFLTSLSKSTGGRRAIDYTISIDMAKELAMLERNEKGRQARTYFINAEKELRQLQQKLIEGFGFEQLRELIGELRIIELEGKQWYPVTQMLQICFRANPAGATRRKIKRMAVEGKVKKLVFSNYFRPAWYVQKDHIKEVLSIDRRMVASTAFVKLLNAGGGS